MGFFSSLFGGGSNSSSGNSETRTNSYRSGSDVFAGTYTGKASLYNKSTGGEIETGYGCGETSKGAKASAQRGLEGKLSKK